MPRPPTPQVPSPSAEDKAQARKVLAAVIEKRQVLRGKQASVTPAAGFQAHRCAVLYDPRIFGKEREANGPFRTSCSDWVPRGSQSLAIKDAERPCAVAQYGPSLAGCSSWVDHRDAGSGKWVVVWRKSSP